MDRAGKDAKRADVVPVILFLRGSRRVSCDLANLRNGAADEREKQEEGGDGGAKATVLTVLATGEDDPRYLWGNNWICKAKHA